MPTATPILPFPEYKWKWASLAPTESLNEPSVFLGVLRVFAQFEGRPPRDPDVAAALRQVEEATNCDVDLDRTDKRNLVRNSGQYWKAKGLMLATRGKIFLTDFGRSVAQGSITKAEFAAEIIANQELPNPFIFSEAEVAQWNRASLKIKPLQLILKIVSSLKESEGPQSAYITPFELAKIVIPLSGCERTPNEQAKALSEYRLGELDIGNWPNCVPEANDLRIVREFLLFLGFYGYLEQAAETEEGRFHAKFKLPIAASEEITLISNLSPRVIGGYGDLLETIRLSGMVAGIERRRSLRSVMERPKQAAFRRSVLERFGSRCFITDESVPDVLEAAHIIPVENGGGDVYNNGLCLRSDVHILFDAGHIRIRDNGEVVKTALVQSSVSYAPIPARISIPAHVDRNCLRWRWDYL